MLLLLSKEYDMSKQQLSVIHILILDFKVVIMKHFLFQLVQVSIT